MMVTITDTGISVQKGTIGVTDMPGGMEKTRVRPPIVTITETGEMMATIKSRLDESHKNHRKGATMFCPKCKAKIGLHRYKTRTLSHLVQGMNCCVCGYWVEGEVSAANTVKSSKRAGKR